MEYILREISKADLPVINKWRNDKEVIDLLGNNFFYIAYEVDENWYNDYLQNRSKAIRLAIVDNELNITIGTVQLTNIHPINKSAEFSIMIGDKNYWSKGAGYFATNAMLEHGFKNLNLHRIYLTVLANNNRATQLYKKAGFQYEGTLHDAIFKNGEYLNLICMAIIKNNNS